MRDKYFNPPIVRKLKTTKQMEYNKKSEKSEINMKEKMNKDNI